MSSLALNTNIDALENDGMVHVVLKIKSCTNSNIYHDKSESNLTVVLAREYIKQCTTQGTALGDDLPKIAAFLPFAFTGMRKDCQSFEATIPATIATFILSKETIKFTAQEAEYVLSTAEGDGVTKGATKQRAELSARVVFEPSDAFAVPTTRATHEAKEWIFGALKHHGLKPLDARRATNELGAPIRAYYVDFEVPSNFYPGRLHNFAFGLVRTPTGHMVEFHFPKTWVGEFNICGMFKCLACHPCACDRKRERGAPNRSASHAHNVKRAKLATLMLAQGSME
jgi:hypothetical protein